MTNFLNKGTKLISHKKTRIKDLNPGFKYVTSQLALRFYEV